ncbi:MAG: MFS transporter, partial [Sciscionella sp.]|nr:MFS transporter [Sciscionella sp.]
MTTTTQSKPLAIEPASDNSDNRRWFMLIVLLLGQFMALMDVTIVNVAMNTVRVDLHASGAELQLVSAGYFVSYAMLLITGARLGDLYGRRRMFGIGVVVFTASSLVCGLAPNIAVLIIARFVQGAGAAAMMPQIMSVIQLRFTGAARARALSAYSAVISVGAVAGMVLGGILVNADIAGTGWRAVFLVNVPIGVVVTALVPRLVPADRPTGRRRLDLLGLSIALPAVFAIVFPLVLGHELGWPAWTFGCVIAGAVLAVVFVLVERTVADPLLRLDVLRARGMPSGLATLALGMLAYGGFLFSFGLYLQSGMGQTALHAGLIFAPGAAAFGLCGYHWRRLPERVHHLLTVGGYLL